MSRAPLPLKRPRARSGLGTPNVKRRKREIPSGRLTARVLRDEEIFGDCEVWTAEKDTAEKKRRRKERDERKEIIEDVKKERSGDRKRRGRDGGKSLHVRKRRRVRVEGLEEEDHTVESKQCLSDNASMKLKSRKGNKTESKLEHWTKMGTDGCYRAPRTLKETLSQFDKLPWRINRTLEEAEFLGGVERLAEKCLRATKKEVVACNLVDFTGVPDDFVFGILAGTANSSTLEKIESHCPDKVAALDAVWAKLCQSEYKLEELPNLVPRWRALHEIKSDERNSNLDKAKERLQKRYAVIDAQKKKRQLSTTLIAPVRPPTRKFGSRNSTMNPLQKLRLELRKTRIK